MIIRVLFSLLLLSCIFDPADLIFGLKVPLFVSIIVYSIVTKRMSFSNTGLCRYIFLFSIILPLFSFIIGIITNYENYDNPNLFGAIKPYLFLFIAFSFQNDEILRTDIIKVLAYELLLLSIVSLILLEISILGIIPFEVLYEFGYNNTVYAIGERSYGLFTINRIYFHSAPMLVFALCFFLNQFLRERKFHFLLFSFIVSAALFFSGTRNDMVMGVIPYFAFAYIYGSKRVKKWIVVLFIISMVYLLSLEFVVSLFDKSEASNSRKIGFLSDYGRAFSNLRTIIIGDGLDSYFFTADRGRVNNSELTYLELLRRFGFFGASSYLLLMLRPAIELLKRPGKKWMGLSYALYLVMIAFNPFFFSSNGMVILSVVLVEFYSKRKRSRIVDHTSVCPA